MYEKSMNMGQMFWQYGFLKKKLTPKLFIQFRQDINSEKNIKEKIILSHALSYDIKYKIKKFEKEINSTQKELIFLRQIQQIEFRK